MRMVKRWMVTACAACGLGSSGAAVPGAFEGFPTVANGESWSVFDFFDESVFVPNWRDGDDPFIEFDHQADWGLWFFTDETNGSPDWLGDYEAAEIESISTDVFVASPSDLAEIDCAVLTDGPAGIRDYFSLPFIDADFPEAGWWFVTFPLETSWFYLDEDDQFVGVEMEAADFAAVEEIGFRFCPKIGTTAELVAAIDNVSLDPRVRAPELTVSRGSGDFVLAFTPPEANETAIETLVTDGSATWKEVPGQTGLGGPGVHVFTTPLAGGTEIFRVRSEARFTQLAID